MGVEVTDEQVEQLASTARPFSVALLRWAPARRRDGAEETERAHQRRMVAMRADGTIAVLSPVLSDDVAGIAIMTVPVEEAGRIMAGDPCVRAGMMTCETYPSLGFPGDTLPG